MNKALKLAADVIKDLNIDIRFTLLEIGARQTGADNEPFYELLNYFPSSRVIGFEINQDDCDKMNASAQDGVEYFPYALGELNEERQLYITNHPMCCSLYKPNEDLISLYKNLEVSYLKSLTRIQTVALDNFIESNDVGAIDFIKIDVQGAELDIFKGGRKALENVLTIVSEVEFLPMYEDQPLFGDVCKFLEDYDFMFNKFLGLAGRSLRPIIVNNDVNFPSQHFWSDAVFIRKIQNITKLSDEELLKQALLAAVYGSLDLTHYCLTKFDERNFSSLAANWLQKIAS